MNLYLLFLIIISLIGIKIFIKDSNKDYMSIDDTKCIKGIFVLIVFYSHLATYFDPLYPKDFLMLNFRDFLGQLMVTPFLFYSGYGIYESIKAKKEAYVNSMPKRRILKTWLNFVLAMIVFLILSIVFQRDYSKTTIALSFIGWTTLGNSNWYVFSILFMYILTFVSFKIFDKNDKKAIILNVVLTLLYILTMKIFKDDYWFNTVLCYNFGMIFSYNKKKIDKVLLDNKKYLYILPIIVIAFIAFRHYYIGYQNFEVYSIIFVTMIAVISVKIKLRSPILKWFGNNVFFMYILQRVPMIIFQETPLINHVYRYSLVCFVCTIILTFIFDKISKLLFKLLRLSDSKVDKKIDKKAVKKI